MSQVPPNTYGSYTQDQIAQITSGGPITTSNVMLPSGTLPTTGQTVISQLKQPNTGALLLAGAAVLALLLLTDKGR